jgi:hypothetical protein
MREAYRCRAVTSVDHHVQKSKGGGKGGRGGGERWMAWNLLTVSCAGGRGRKEGRDAMNRGGKKWKNVEDSSSRLSG